MKSKLRISKKLPNPKEGELPDPPVRSLDLPEVLPTISHHEVLAYANAKFTFQLAQADYEMKRAGLILKLRQGCHANVEGFFVTLDDGADRLVVIDDSSDIPLIVDGTRKDVADWQWALEKGRCATAGQLSDL
jgi:hypothetical protein